MLFLEIGWVKIPRNQTFSKKKKKIESVKIGIFLCGLWNFKVKSTKCKNRFLISMYIKRFDQLEFTNTGEKKTQLGLSFIQCCKICGSVRTGQARVHSKKNALLKSVPFGF